MSDSKSDSDPPLDILNRPVPPKPTKHHEPSCSVCVHPARVTIDTAIREGATTRKLAQRFGLSQSAVVRHQRTHVHRALIPTQDLTALSRKTAHAVVDGVLKGAGIAQELSRLKERTERIASQLELAGESGVISDPRTALLAIKELRSIIELQARLALEAAQGRAQDLASNPIWHAVMGDLMLALADYPDAQQAVLLRLRLRLGYDPEKHAFDGSANRP